MSETAWLWIYSAVIIAMSMGGGYLPLLGRLSHTRMQLYLSASAGVMLGASFFHIMPEAMAFSGGWFGWWTCAGVLTLLAIERFLAPHSHGSGAPNAPEPDTCSDPTHHYPGDGHEHCEPGHSADHCHDPGHAHHPIDKHGHPPKLNSPPLAGWLASGGLALHTFMNGFGLAGAVHAGGAHGDHAGHNHAKALLPAGQGAVILLASAGTGSSGAATTGAVTSGAAPAPKTGAPTKAATGKPGEDCCDDCAADAKGAKASAAPVNGLIAAAGADSAAPAKPRPLPSQLKSGPSGDAPAAKPGAKSGADCCTDGHDHAGHSHGHSHAEAPDPIGLRGFLATLGIPGLSLFLAIALHKPADALAVSMILTRRGVSRGQVVLAQLAFALMVPAGVVAYAIAAATLDLEHELVGFALAFSAGTFLFVALSDLLPEVQFHRHDRGKLMGALIGGVLLMGFIGYLEGHSHGGGGHSH